MRIFTVIALIAAFFEAVHCSGVNAMSLENSQNQKIIILLGPPGSGKGTQAKRITEKTGLPHISTGDLFRYNIKNETELGKKAQTYMNSGKLVPDELVLDMLFDRVSQEDCREGYLLDGFPRTIPQAESFSKYLPEESDQIAVNLEVSDDTIIRRISQRWSCRYCGNVQNAATPSKVEGKCDRCGGELYQREDDKPEVVKERLSVYKEQTAPLVEYYSRKGLLYTVNGEQGADLIFQKIMDRL